MLDQVRAGFAHIRDQRVLRNLIGAYGSVCLFGAAVLPIEVVFIVETLQGSESDYGLVLTLWGIGAIGGSATLPLLRGIRLPWLVVGSFAVMGVSYLGMGLSEAIPALAAFSFLGGVGNGVEAFATVTAIQERTNPAFQARVNGIVESAGAAAIGLGFLLGGVIATMASPRDVYLIAAAGIFLSAIAAGQAEKPRRQVESPRKAARKRSMYRLGEPGSSV